LKRFAITTILLAGIHAVALAGTGVAAPEIDAATGVAAVTLLAGAVLIIRGRRRSKLHN